MGGAPPVCKPQRARPASATADDLRALRRYGAQTPPAFIKFLGCVCGAVIPSCVFSGKSCFAAPLSNANLDSDTVALIDSPGGYSDMKIVLAAE